MKYIKFFTFLFCFGVFESNAQDICTTYKCVIDKVKKNIEDEKFEEAFRNLESADGYPNKNKNQIKELREKMFYKLNALKDRALAQQIIIKRSLDSLRAANASRVKLLLEGAENNGHDEKFELAFEKIIIAQSIDSSSSLIQPSFQLLQNAMLKRVKHYIEVADFQNALNVMMLLKKFNFCGQDYYLLCKNLKFKLCQKVETNIVLNNYDSALIHTNFLTFFRDSLDGFVNSNDTIFNYFSKIIFCLYHIGTFDEVWQIHKNLNLIKEYEGKIKRTDFSLSNYSGPFKQAKDIYFPECVKILNPSDSSFHFIASKEITFWEYDLFCVATHRKKPDENAWGRGNLPVINVSWFDALAYCNWRSKIENLQPVYTFKPDEPLNVIIEASKNGYRLPSEQEWIYIEGIYNSQNANFADSSLLEFHSKWITGGNPDDGFPFTAPVGFFGDAELNLFDIFGNVLEWSGNPLINNPSNGFEAQAWGCSWSNAPKDCNNHQRIRLLPDTQNINLGFRVARNGIN